MTDIQLIKKEAGVLATPQRAQVLARYFKTGPGQYGEGDIFLGLTADQIKKLADKYRNISLENIRELLQDKIHEHRSIALGILSRQFDKADPEKKKTIYHFYLKNTKFINNWDLVDSSASNIVGAYLQDINRLPLYQLAKSKNLWERRIAIMSTLTFIRQNQFEDTLKISRILLKDPHDLIHKAVGWMLREVGKRNQGEEEKFLKKYADQMPRTMLRYTIEKFSPEKRKYYLNFKNQNPKKLILTPKKKLLKMK